MIGPGQGKAKQREKKKSISADCFRGPNGGLRFVETADDDDGDIKAMLLNVMEARANRTVRNTIPMPIPAEAKE